MIQVANPIYDVVFKFLMEDNSIAKMYISKIIDEEILDLELCPQEKIASIGYRDLTVYRLDFKARIKTDDGFKIVLIEIQKAKLASDIMRFRKYLGEQYSDKNNVYTLNESSEEYGKPCPIISIYFLGYKLDHIDAAVVKVKRKIYDAATNLEIFEKEEFIESLTHDSYIIQIPLLKGRRRTDLEIALSVFDQSNRDKDEHILNVNEADFPEECRQVTRRLQYAVTTKEIRDVMDLEDEIIKDFQDLERQIAKKQLLLIEQDQVLVEKDQALVAKDQALVEKEKALTQKDQEIADLRKALNLLNQK